MCLLMEFVFWKLGSEISSGLSGKNKAVNSGAEWRGSKLMREIQKE